MEFPKKKKKKRGPGNFFRVALYMLKQSKSQKKNAADVNSNSIWKTFVDSMRPLCVQNHHPPTLAAGSPVSDHTEVFTAPMSPASAGMSTSSSWGNISQYASALNLQELDQTAENQYHGDDKDGDELIDAKAELFIAQFYREIEVQNQVYKQSRNKRVA